MMQQPTRKEDVLDRGSGFGLGDRFALPNVSVKGYEKQYCGTYKSRSAQMKEKIMRHARAKWGRDCTIVDKIIECQNQNVNCILVGTIFKELKLRNSVIEDVKEGLQLSGSVSFMDKFNYASKEDNVYLEDDSGRILLKVTNETLLSSGYFDPQLLVTGVVIGVKGKISDANGDETFEVEDVVYFGDVSSVSNDDSSSSSSGGGGAAALISSSFDSSRCFVTFDKLDSSSSFLVLVSGFEFDEDDFDPKSSATSSSNAMATSLPPVKSDYDISTQLFIDFISGKLGDARMKAISKNITRVIVAGNSVVPAKHKDLKDRHASSKKDIQDASKNLKRADSYFAELLATCPVTLLPGASDPALMFMPQQAFNKYLFPTSNRFSSLTLSTNPVTMNLSYDGGKCPISIMGHSGQSSLDISLQITDERGAATAESMQVSGVGGGDFADSDYDPWLQIQARLVQWGHVAPSCPDTLPGYPLNSFNIPTSNSKVNNKLPEDYFVITDKPDIFFAGNQPFFGCGILTTQEVSREDDQLSSKETLLVNVPSFKFERTAVIIDVNSKQCSIISFNNDDSANCGHNKSRRIISKDGEQQARDKIDFADDTQGEEF